MPPAIYMGREVCIHYAISYHIIIGEASVTAVSRWLYWACLEVRREGGGLNVYFDEIEENRIWLHFYIEFEYSFSDSGEVEKLFNKY